MKLISYCKDGREYAGVLSRDGKTVFPLSVPEGCSEPMLYLIQHGLMERLPQLYQQAEKGGDACVPISSVQLISPIPHPGDFLCIGLNYQTHASAVAKERGEVYKPNKEPAYFSKRTFTCTTDGDSILQKDGYLESLEGGAELAIIIGKDALNVSREDAWDYILGYSVHNDLCELTTNKLYVQPMQAKSFDGYAPVGPWIVTADEFGKDHVWRIQLSIGGELRADDTTDHMSFDIPYMVSQLSTHMTLKAGTIIASGSPGETLPGIAPKHYPLPGEDFVCTIEGIGSLTTHVVAGEISPPYSDKVM